MAGILKRFADIMSANINALLDKAEDPEVMIDQYLRELNENLGNVIAETAAIMAEEARAKREMDDCAAEVEKLQAYAEKAVVAGNDDDARTFLEQKGVKAAALKALQDAYNLAVSEATALAKALRESGYELACYTYANVPYGDYSASMVKSDINQWLTEALPILGQVDTMVFAQQSDITNSEVYSGEKFTTLQSAGFRYYLGFCTEGQPWASVNSNYVRQGRILVSGANMAYHAEWFADLFDTSTVLDTDIRGTIPA